VINLPVGLVLMSALLASAGSCGMEKSSESTQRSGRYTAANLIDGVFTFKGRPIEDAIKAFNVPKESQLPNSIFAINDEDKTSERGGAAYKIRLMKMRACRWPVRDLGVVMPGNAEVVMIADENQIVRLAGVMFEGNGHLTTNGTMYGPEVDALPTARWLWSQIKRLAESRPEKKLDAIGAGRGYWQNDRFSGFFFFQCTGKEGDDLVRVGLVSRESPFSTENPNSPPQYVNNYNWQNCKVLGVYVGDKSLSALFPFLPYQGQVVHLN